MNNDTQIFATATDRFARAVNGRSAGGGGRNRERMCLVTRQIRPESELIRFVSGPDGVIVPDIQSRLPGRGVWVTAERTMLEQAASRKLFARGLKADVRVQADLADQVAGLLKASALGRLGLARKAGQLAVGFTKVASAVEGSKAAAVLIAADAAEDGRRKMQAIVRRNDQAGGLQTIDRWSSKELSLAIGRTNVIHAAVLAGSAGGSFKQAVLRLLRFEGLAGEDAVKPQDSDV